MTVKVFTVHLRQTLLIIYFGFGEKMQEFEKLGLKWKRFYSIDTTWPLHDLYMSPSRYLRTGLRDNTSINETEYIQYTVAAFMQVNVGQSSSKKYGNHFLTIFSMMLIYCRNVTHSRLLHVFFDMPLMQTIIFMIGLKCVCDVTRVAKRWKIS